MTLENKDDLKFIPLNIKEPLTPGYSKFPLIMNMDGISIGTNSNNIFLNFSTISPSIMTNPNELSNLKTNCPLTPYPDSIPEMEANNILLNNNMSPSIIANDILSDKLLEDDLYSYNESSFDRDYFKNSVDHMELLKTLEISIEDFDLYDRGKKYDNHIDEVFKDIEENYKGIIATMRTYRIPYPIAKLLIKRIIEITIKDCKR